MYNQIISNKEFSSQFKQRLLCYGVACIQYVDSLPKTSSGYVLGKQLLRSSTSVGANYFEAQAANSRKDFINFLTIALKSANESEYWFLLLIKAGIGNSIESQKLHAETIELARILGKSVKSLRS